MKLLTLTALTALLTACGGSGGSSSSSGDPGAVSVTRIFEQDLETTDLLIYGQHLPYPGNDVLIIDDKTGGGGNGCSGRIQTYQGAKYFELSLFAGGCSHLNGTYDYRLTTTCQGYAQATLVCGSTATVEIVMSKRP